MQIAMNDLKLVRLCGVYPGDRRCALSDRVEVVPLQQLAGPGTDGDSLFKRRRR